MGFARNAWYVAAFSEEVERSLLGRTILGDPVVMFRQLDDSVAAVSGICPHRFAPLAKGHLIGNQIQCAYHGLEFDGTGHCVKNPQSGERIISALNIPSYVVHEKHSLVWIWMGDAARADTSAIPDFSHLTDPVRRQITGHSTVGCHYQLLIDNLMDLGHFQYLHAGMAKIDSGFTDVKREVRQEGATVYNNLLFPGCKPTVLFQPGLKDPTITVDQFNDIRWDAVGLMRNFVGVTPTGQPREAGINHYGTHIVTPETESSSHYFYGSSRNFAQDNPVSDGLFRQWQQRALNEEDKPMLEAIQRLLPAVQRAGMKMTMLSSDGAAVRVQRAIEEMVAAESTHQYAPKEHVVTVDSIRRADRQPSL